MRSVAPRAGLILALMAVLSVGCRAQTNEAPSLREEFRRNILAGRQPAPLKPQVLSASDVGALRAERVRFTPEEGHDAVAVLFRPKAEGKYPAVIVQHFLGATKDHIALLPLYNGLAQRGYMVVAIDGRYRGDRQNGKPLETALLESLRTGKGKPFLVDTAYDVLRLVDYLETRPDVDPKRIGMAGFSEGGIITWMCAAADERIQVAVPIIGVTAFGETFNGRETEFSGAAARLLEPVLKEFARDLGEPAVNAKVMRAAWDKLVPGMLDRFDAQHVLPLIAPRPLLILNHEQDELFPLEGAKKVHSSVRARYEELKAADRQDFRIAPGLKHSGLSLTEVSHMMEWLDRWLKKEPQPTG